MTYDDDPPVAGEALSRSLRRTLNGVAVDAVCAAFCFWFGKLLHCLSQLFVPSVGCLRTSKLPMCEIERC